MNVNRPRNPFIRLSKFVQITTRAQYTEKKTIIIAWFHKKSSSFKIFGEGVTWLIDWIWKNGRGPYSFWPFWKTFARKNCMRLVKRMWSFPVWTLLRVLAPPDPSKECHGEKLYAILGRSWVFLLARWQSRFLIELQGHRSSLVGFVGSVVVCVPSIGLHVQWSMQKWFESPRSRPVFALFVRGPLPNSQDLSSTRIKGQAYGINDPV